MVSVRMSLRRSSALSSRAGRSLGRRRPANIRLSPGVPRRLRPNPRQTYFVILSVSEGSIWGKVTDSSSIFRSPQNDNAVFALNHFLSGTHSSARPGRLRGSRLWARAGPGRKVFRIRKRKSLRDMLAIIVILSGANRRTQRVQRPLADYAEQGGERQTKCSQTSVSSAYRFFVALLLRMTNCFLIVHCEF